MNGHSCFPESQRERKVTTSRDNRIASEASERSPKDRKETQKFKSNMSSPKSLEPLDGASVPPQASSKQQETKERDSQKIAILAKSGQSECLSFFLDIDVV